jgi:hypothetical protein
MNTAPIPHASHKGALSDLIDLPDIITSVDDRSYLTVYDGARDRPCVTVDFRILVQTVEAGHNRRHLDVGRAHDVVH